MTGFGLSQFGFTAFGDPTGVPLFDQTATISIAPLMASGPASVGETPNMRMSITGIVTGSVGTSQSGSTAKITISGALD